MKGFIFSIILLLSVAGCGSGSGSDSDTGYIVQPGGLTKFDTGLTSHEIDFSGAKDCSPSPQCYAIIYNANVGGTDYVGIAVSTDPSDSNAFNLKIYFPSSSIPDSINLDSSNSIIKVRNSGTTYDVMSGSITLNFGSPDDNNVIEITGGVDKTITLTGQDLTINTINALLVTSIPSDD